MTEPVVRFEKLHDDVSVPRRSTAHSAGYDIRAYLKGRCVRLFRDSGTEPVSLEAQAGQDSQPAYILLQPGDRALIPTGFRAGLPAGYEAQIRMRSSVAYRKGLVAPNAPGTVDADYPDEWFVLVQNASGGPQRVEHGERIAQVVLNRHEVLPWRESAVGVTTDRVGGFGSTGS